MSLPPPSKDQYVHKPSGRPCRHWRKVRNSYTKLWIIFTDQSSEVIKVDRSELKEIV